MLLVVLLLAGARALDGAESGQPYPWGDDDDDANFYNHYNEKVVSSSPNAMTPTQDTLYTRIRRNDQATSPVRTLSPNEIREVKGALHKMMEGRDLNMLTSDSVTDLRRLVDLLSSPTPDLMSDLTRFTSNHTEESTIDVARQGYVVKEVIFKKKLFEKIEKVYLDLPNTNAHYMYALNKRRYEKKHHPDLEATCLSNCLSDSNCKSVVSDSDDWECLNYMFTIKNNPFYKLKYNYYYNYYELIGDEPTTIPPTTTENGTTTLLAITPPQIIDIRRLVQIIANLTMNTIESNLTELFNATLLKYGIPMCGDDTTTTEEPSYDFANATIVSKCFVCGLDTPGIPHDAYCADAFAGDFLPLVPVDPRAKGQIARYRKYCRYLDVPGMMINDTEAPRSVFGRWTGGCSVRWIDLSGVYTQRSCRNRRHAVMGHHYVSKRMAKLELALKNEDNGCIISPMSSLVPLSRGVSLYARFHACVCQGNWCNDTPRVEPVRLTVLTALTTLASMAIIA